MAKIIAVREKSLKFFVLYKGRKRTPLAFTREVNIISMVSRFFWLRFRFHWRRRRRPFRRDWWRQRRRFSQTVAASGRKLQWFVFAIKRLVDLTNSAWNLVIQWWQMYDLRAGCICIGWSRLSRSAVHTCTPNIACVYHYQFRTAKLPLALC